MRAWWCYYFHRGIAWTEHPSGYVDYFCPRCGRALGSVEALEKA